MLHMGMDKGQGAITTKTERDRKASSSCTEDVTSRRCPFSPGSHAPVNANG